METKRIYFKDMNQDDEYYFVIGFEDAGGDTDAAFVCDVTPPENPFNMCLPWKTREYIDVTGDTPYEWGKSWYEQNKEYLENFMNDFYSGKVRY